MNEITVVLTIIAIALGASGLTFGIIEHNTVSTMQAQLAQQRLRERQDQAKVGAELRYIGGHVANLNVPTDPLSAYNEICNQQMQNSLSGNYQTFYFPCTN